MPKHHQFVEEQVQPTLEENQKPTKSMLQNFSKTEDTAATPKEQRSKKPKDKKKRRKKRIVEEIVEVVEEEEVEGEAQRKVVAKNGEVMKQMPENEVRLTEENSMSKK